MIFVVCQKDRVVGTFDNYNTCVDNIKGISNLGWANDLTIKKFTTNSFNFISELDPLKKDEDKNDKDNKDDKEDDEIKKKKKEDIRKKHMENIKQQQKKLIEESKNKYKTDYNLYLKFKEFKEKDENFKIPELFEKKYEIMEKLDSENNLYWDTFNTEYREEDYTGKNKNIFDVANEYEASFTNKLSEDSDNESDDSEDDSETEDKNTFEVMKSPDSFLPSGSDSNVEIIDYSDNENSD
jgi:hypothetical protein